MRTIKMYFGGAARFGHGGNDFHDLTTSILEGIAQYEETGCMEDADIIYWVYGPGPTLYKNVKLWFGRKKIILHWIGTDVLNVQRRLTNSFGLGFKIYYSLWRAIIKHRSHKGTLINLAGASWLTDELKSVGFNSQVIAFTTIDQKYYDKLLDVKKEKDIDFLSYLPQTRFSFFGGDRLINMAKKMPSFQFLIIVPDITDIDEFDIHEVPSNVSISPRIPRNKVFELYNRSKVFLRLTEHDGLSLSVLEALLFELNVVWTCQFPYVNYVSNVTDDNIYKLMLEAVHSPRNSAAREYVARNFSLANVQRQFSKIKGFDKFFETN